MTGRLKVIRWKGHSNRDKNSVYLPWQDKRCECRLLQFFGIVLQTVADKQKLYYCNTANDENEE